MYIWVRYKLEMIRHTFYRSIDENTIRSETNQIIEIETEYIRDLTMNIERKAKSRRNTLEVERKGGDRAEKSGWIVNWSSVVA